MTLSLKARFLLAALLVTGLVFLYAVFTLRGQQATDTLIREALSKDLTAMHLASEIKDAMVFYDDLVFRFLATGDDGLIEESGRVLDKIKKAMARLKSETESATVQELLAELEAESDGYFKDAQKLLATAPRPVGGEKQSMLGLMLRARQLSRQQKAVGVISNEGQAKLIRIYALCNKLVDLNRVRMEEVQRETRQTLDEGRKGIRMGGLAVFAGTTFIGWLLALSILSPLRELLSGIQKIMGGDLNFEIIPRGADEIGRITQAFNAMTRNLKGKQEQLLRETITDALTGLYNFRYFQEELKNETERARRYARPLSVVLIDIDYFKKYNDTHGHEMGNVVLKTVAAALRETLRPTDVLARYGGEEFVAFLPETDKTQAQRVAERLREAVDACQFPGQDSGKLTISLGGACFPEDAKVSKDLVEKADKRLYQAKHKGRNRVEWS